MVSWGFESSIFRQMNLLSLCCKRIMAGRPDEPGNTEG